MTDLTKCTLLFIKRGFKKISLIALLISMPLLSYYFKSTVNSGEPAVYAGLYVASDDETCERIKENLLKDFGSVSFVLYSSEEKLKQDVISEKLECGYTIPEDFTDRLRTNNFQRIIISYSNPSSFLLPLTNEYIFSEVFTEYAFYELTRFIANEPRFDLDEEDLPKLMEELRPVFEKNLEDDSLFYFEYINPDKEEPVEESGLFTSYVMFSLRGILALIVMFTAFIGTLHLYTDNKNGIFRSFYGIKKVLCQCSEIFSITILGCLSALISLYTGGVSGDFFIEVFHLLCYALLCTIYCYVLFRIIPGKFGFAALIPVMILGSIIFCPIFFDFAEIIPQIKYVGYAFLPHYFMHSRNLLYMIF